MVLPRTLPFQGYYWVHLTKIVKKTECAATAIHLHKSLLKLCGYVSPVYSVHGKVISLETDSTAFEAMGEDDFHIYVDHAKRALAEHLGIVWEDYGLVTA